ncbi:uroporphyrinogen III methylase [Legionella geestiana]|uniref:Uroporphyrinogen III methylase n=1 Tax=Legionella geestiana TaxID=45065 RepID=A0A0W0TLR5_9GAMM|nr:uroporphyrinogen-III C-methyltransferase [Legionella geestiana]KTC96461.1 uroporphyrinogen III methylase [Legionella geestiana]STX55052.1 uroporphyrin-III C-methyltransferase [Legionella geestiana]
MQNENGEKATSKTLETTGAPSEVKATEGHRRRPSGVSLLLLGLVAGGAFLLWQQHDALHTEMLGLTADNSLLREEQTRLQTRLQTLTTTDAANREALGAQFNTLAREVRESLQQKDIDANTWMLPKARYFLELARMNATWSNTPETTIALLQQADALLALITSPDVSKVRKAIAAEILAIKATPAIDTTGLLSQLDAAREALVTLPLDDRLIAKETNVTAAENQQPESRTWRTRLQESVGLLEKLVVVRQQTDGLAPLPTPLQEAVIRESVRLNLEEAQWALLRSNQAIWQFALNQAMDSIRRHFDTDAPATKAVSESLEALKNTPLTASAPAPMRALQMLNDMLQVPAGTPADEAGSPTS